MSELQKLIDRKNELLVLHEVRRKFLEETEIDLKAIKIHIAQIEEEEKRIQLVNVEF